MRHGMVVVTVALGALIAALAAAPALAGEPSSPGASGQPYDLYTWTGLQQPDNGAAPAEQPAPPVPPPPPSSEVPEAGPAGVPAELAPPAPAAEPMPQPCAPPPAYYERQGPAPAAAAPQNGCCIRRDECGWDVWGNGCRYGRFEVWLEGSYAFLKAPEGLFGLPPYIAGPLAAPDPLSYDGLDYSGAWGGRGTFRYMVAPQEFVELRGTYYGKWSDSTRDAGQFGFLPGPAGVGGVSAPNAATFDAEAKVYGAELNYWNEVACMGYTSWSLGAGARWLQFNETVSATNWTAPFAPFNTPPFAQSDVKNRFIGLQLGTMARYEITPCFDVTLTLKGMLGNLNRKINVSDRSFFSGGAHAASSKDDEIVFGADADLNFRYRITHNIALTAGYNLLFLDNVVRAHDAMDFTFSNSGAIQAQQKVDQLIVHSFLVGLHFNF